MADDGAALAPRGSPLGTFLRFDFAFKVPLLRDRYTCTHPMCSSREPGPHHLRFQAHGGGDEDWNVAGLCYWCHIELVHQYLARVMGRAPDDLTWWLGDAFVVQGRHFEELEKLT